MTSPPTPAPDDEGPPTDPGVDASRPPLPSVLAVVAVGGVVGALARYRLDLSWPVPPAGFPWSTVVVNVSGCLLIGIALIVIVERMRTPPLVRPFLVTGVLGGYTTFSTYAVDLHRLLRTGHPGIAVGYLAATLFGALAATAVGVQLARRVRAS
ncbi:MAG: fluoride efflux transporter CrcB [Nakamurella sp.]